MSLEYSEPEFVDPSGRADSASSGFRLAGLPTAPILTQKLSPREFPLIANIRAHRRNISELMPTHYPREKTRPTARTSFFVSFVSFVVPMHERIRPYDASIE
jgi:hypothetical protein